MKGNILDENGLKFKLKKNSFVFFLTTKILPPLYSFLPNSVRGYGHHLSVLFIPSVAPCLTISNSPFTFLLFCIHFLHCYNSPLRFVHDIWFHFLCSFFNPLPILPKSYHRQYCTKKDMWVTFLFLSNSNICLISPFDS